MVWVTWRQHRAQILLTVGFVVVLGVALLVHGLLAASASSGLAPGSPELMAALGGRFRLAYQVLGWLPYLPVLVGVFWGAPLLAREFERGTFRIAWTQSVPRRRWIEQKLVVLGGLVLLTGLAQGAIVSAWLEVFEGTRYVTRFGDAAMFGGTGVLAGVWWLFAFLLGAAAGAVFRRLLPAMAVTIALFVVVLFAVIVFGRDHYGEPVLVGEPGSEVVADSWVDRWVWIDSAGREHQYPEVPACAGVGDSYWDCMRGEGYQQVAYVHPSDRYWRFQLTESGILLAISGLLVVLLFRSCRPARIRTRR